MSKLQHDKSHAFLLRFGMLKWFISFLAYKIWVNKSFNYLSLTHVPHKFFFNVFESYHCTNGQALIQSNSFKSFGYENHLDV